MSRTLKNRFCSAVLWSCVIFVILFRTDGAEGAASNSSSGVTQDDGTDGGDGESSVEKGMRPFFDMVKSFLGVVQPKKITEQSWLNLSQIVKDGKVQTEQLKDWKNWVTYLVGFVVCAAVGVLFFVVMPIAGLVFCCCRCAGKCGAGLKPTDPKHAGCKRTTYCTLLLVLNTVALAGVVCTFLSNQILYDKLRNLNDVGPTGKLISSADMVNGFVTTTIDEVEDAVLTRFEDASVTIIREIRVSAGDSVDAALTVLNATSLLRQSKDVASDVADTQQALDNVAEKLNTLSTQGAMLSANLSSVKGQIDSVCSPPTLCQGYDPADYDVSANFSGLSDLSAEAANIAKSVNLSQYISEAESTVDSAKRNATATVDSGITEATSSVNDTKQKVKEGVDKFTTDLQTSVTSEVDKFRSDIEDVQDNISEYSKYVWYGGIGIGCALLLVVMMYYVGILFGLCGERPGFGAQCCNTGTGANFLMAGVGITFLLGWLIMLVCIILFVTGGPIYTEVCRYLDNHDPQALKPFSDAVMEQLDLQNSLFKGKDVTLNLVDILEGCEDDGAIYSVLQLDNMVNISQYTDLTEVNKALEKLKTDTFQIPDVSILTVEMNQSISDFASAGLDGIPFSGYKTEMDKNLTKGNLPQLANQLRVIANTEGMLQDKRNSLLAAAHQLDALQRDYVVPMQDNEDSMRASLAILETKSASKINESTNALLNGLQKAQDNFNDQKDQLVQDEVVKLISNTMKRVNGVVNDMLTDVEENIGKCRPVYDGFYSATDAVCVAALEAMNGLWFSIGWCLFFFVPSLVFAVKLAGLYRREHEERDFDDPQQQSGRSADDPSDPRLARGVPNQGYHDDSHLGPSDYPNYKGGAVNAGYQHDGYRGSAPPPYTAPRSYHDGPMNGNSKAKDYDYRY